jgi:hypothetical protein
LRVGVAVRRVLVEAEVGVIFVMVGDVGASEPNQMALAEDDHMVHQLSPAAADPTFRHRILPGTPERCTGR